MKTKEHRTGQLLDAVTLVVLDSTSSVVTRALSGLDGSFEFADVPPGMYTLVAELDGYERKEFTGISVRSGMITFVDVVLERAGAPEGDDRNNVCGWRLDPRRR
ncbi:MAG: carboxypeptidase regulatory-like domain-containing protein [Flavobacteriales bacterium]|nr:carboxypeptidase regulatory-like domain-containing protein [Flavobacteriales bacterium]